MAGTSGNGLVPLIAAKVVCCCGFVLAATGALSGMGAWLAQGGHVWVGVAVGTLLVGLALSCRRHGKAGAQDGTDNADGRDRPGPVASSP